MGQIDQIQWQDQNKPLVEFIKKTNYELEASQWDAQALIAAKLTARIKAILQYCARHVDYYKHIAPEILKENRAFSLDDFQQLPTLSKAEIREHLNQMISRQFAGQQQRFARFDTSGSTGIPITIYRSLENIFYAKALSLRYHLWHKRDFTLTNTSIMTLGEKKEGPVGFWALGVQTGPGYSININQNSRTIFDRLQEINPHYIQTHPSTLKRLVDLSLEQGSNLECLKEVRTFGELLEPHIRQSCEGNWGVPVTDMYSCEEIGPIAYQCPENPHYHVQVENVYVEILNENNEACNVGEPGRIHVTQLNNLAMPLLRYDLGDVAEWGEPCSCGRELPVLKKITGRIRNLASLPNGDTFHPVFDEKAILSVAAGIRQYQFTQKDIHTIEVLIACDEPLPGTTETELAKVFNKSFSHSFQYKFIYQKEIPFSSRNKFEIFKSEVLT